MDCLLDALQNYKQHGAAHLNVTWPNIELAATVLSNSV
jgi:hypothetical protein